MSATESLKAEMYIHKSHISMLQHVEVLPASRYPL